MVTSNRPYVTNKAKMVYNNWTLCPYWSQHAKPTLCCLDFSAGQPPPGTQLGPAPDRR